MAPESPLGRRHHDPFDPETFYDRLNDAAIYTKERINDSDRTRVTYSPDTGIEPIVSDRGYDGIGALVQFYPVDNYLGTNWDDDPDPVVTIRAWLRGGLETSGTMGREIDRIEDELVAEDPGLPYRVKDALADENDVRWDTLPTD